MDRLTLLRTLGRLSPADFAVLVASIPHAAPQISRHGTIPERVAELIRWAESPLGCGLPAVEEAFAASLEGREVGTGQAPPGGHTLTSGSSQLESSESKRALTPPDHHTEPVRLFLSYSYKDERLTEKLIGHLSSLEKEGTIHVWHDKKITPGAEWRVQIDTHLELADVILLLVSSDFLASDYIRNVELTRAMERHEAGTAQVIPVILKPADWYSAPFAKLTALPRNSKPLVEWSNREAAYKNIVDGIREVVESIRGRKELSHPTEFKPGESYASKNTLTDVIEFAVVLSGAIEEFDGPRLDSIVELLRIFSDDATLRLVRVEPGSVKLVLQGTQEGLERLESLLRSGKLSVKLGIDVKEIRWLYNSRSTRTSIPPSREAEVSLPINPVHRGESLAGRDYLEPRASEAVDVTTGHVTTGPRALIMKGGGIKGLAYVGALEILSERYQFDWYIGTSAGAIAAVLLGAGFGVDELKDILKNKEFGDFFDARWYQQPLNLVFYKGLHKAGTLTEWLDTLISRKLRLTTRPKLSDLRRNRVTVYASQRLHDALEYDSVKNDVYASYAARCSMSIPYVFTPQSDQGFLAFDGGVRHNYPVDILLKNHPGTPFISLYLGPEVYEPVKETTLIGTLLSIITEAADPEAIARYRESTVIIDPRPIGTLDFTLSEDEKELLLQAGRVGALAHLAPGTNRLAEARVVLNQLRGTVQAIRDKRDKRRRRRRRTLLGVITGCLILACGWWYWPRLKEITAIFLPSSSAASPAPTVPMDAAVSATISPAIAQDKYASGSDDR